MLKLITQQLAPYIKPYKRKIIGAILLSFILAALGGAQVKLVKPIFDHGLSPDTPIDQVMKLAAILMIIGLLNFPCRFFHFYWLRYIVDHATCAIRVDIFRKMQKLPTSFFAHNKQGNLVSNLINDTQVFAYGFRSSIDLLREPLKAAVYLGLAFYSDWQLTLVIFIIAPFLVAIFSVSGKKVRANQNHVQEEIAELTHNISEGLGSHKITKAFNLQKFVESRFKNSQNKYFDALMRTTFVEEMAHPLVEVVGAMAFSGVIIFAHYRVTSGATTVGDFVSFVAALALFMDPVRKFSQANVKLSQAHAAGNRIFKILELPEEKDDGRVVLDHFQDKIEVKGLSFSYGEGDVLKDFHFEVKKGERVALVGLSGSGKSTLINLLLGLYPVGAGKIFIDGHEISSIKLESLRSLFGLVSQDLFLFHDTIIENIKVGGDFSQQAIDQALHVSYADEFVNKLPEKEMTIVGDRGAKLSGGQAQRVTIARAFLQNSDILLFDEATSALDNESEKVVQKALEKIASDKTVIAVAHRLSTVKDFDRIYVLKEGRLVEEGKHSELMSKAGEYAKLYELSQAEA